jgi:hypothetical protein
LKNLNIEFKQILQLYTCDDFPEQWIRTQNNLALAYIDRILACALEQLAEQYRKTAEAQQNLDWDAVEQSEAGEPIEKQYHVMLHYESTITAPSKFEAMHDTMIGNTVVENAKTTMIEISPDLPIAPLHRSWG